MESADHEGEESTFITPLRLRTRPVRVSMTSSRLRLRLQPPYEKARNRPFGDQVTNHTVDTDVPGSPKDDSGSSTVGGSDGQGGSLVLDHDKRKSAATRRPDRVRPHRLRLSCQTRVSVDRGETEVGGPAADFVDKLRAARRPRQPNLSARVAR